MEERVTQLEELYQNSKDTVDCLKQTVKTLSNSQERDHTLHQAMDRMLAVLDRQSKLIEATNTVTNVVAEKVNLPPQNRESFKRNGDILETVQRIEMYNEIFAKDFSRIYETLDRMEARICGFIEIPDQSAITHQTDGIAKELANLTAKMDRMEKTVDSLIKSEDKISKKQDLDDNLDRNKQIPVLEPKRNVEDKQAVNVGHEILKDEGNIQKVEEIKETDSGVSEETQAKVTLRKTADRPRLFAQPPENETLTVIGEGTEETNETCKKTAKDHNDNIHTEEDNKKGFADIKKMFEQKSNMGGNGACTAKINDVSSKKPAKLNVPSGIEKQNKARHPAAHDTSSSVSYINLKLDDKPEEKQNVSHKTDDACQQTESRTLTASTISIPQPGNLNQSEDGSADKGSGSAAEPEITTEEGKSVLIQNEAAPPGQKKNTVMNLYQVFLKIQSAFVPRSENDGDETIPNQALVDELRGDDPDSGIIYKCRTCEAELPEEVREDGVSVKCTERGCGHLNVVGKLGEGNKWIFTYCNGKFHCHQVPLETEIGTDFTCPICDSSREIHDAHDWAALN